MTRGWLDLTLSDATCRMRLEPFSNPADDRVRQRIDKGVMRILGVDTDLNTLYGWIRNEPQISG